MSAQNALLLGRKILGRATGEYHWLARKDADVEGTSSCIPMEDIPAARIAGVVEKRKEI
jgi:hypothetical protein